jgi:glycosyltransferase involved in cell wall biosynthesis
MICERLGNRANYVKAWSIYGELSILKRIDVICFGGEDWWYHNRAHIDMQLMRRFARMGTTLYVNSIVMQKPNLRRGQGFIQKLARKSRSIIRGLKKSDTGFWVYSPLSLPAHHSVLGRRLNDGMLRLQMFSAARRLGIRDPIVWVACPPACDVAVRMKKERLVYQRTDRLEEFPNVDSDVISAYDGKLKSSADLTIFVNKALYDQEADECRRAIYLDHGVDFEMFASAGDSPDVPADLSTTKRPIVGFFGGLHDHTCDLNLLEKVPAMVPEMSFVFVGRVSADCGGLLANENVFMLGQKPYERIPDYGKCFDVAIMPWRQNRWIEACNPIKLKEYLALGKPVVSTPFPELAEYLDVVYEARTPEEFAESIKRARVEDNPERIEKRRAKVAQASWDSKAQLVLRELFPEAGQAEPDVVAETTSDATRV